MFYFSTDYFKILHRNNRVGCHLSSITWTCGWTDRFICKLLYRLDINAWGLCLTLISSWYFNLKSILTCFSSAIHNVCNVDTPVCDWPDGSYSNCQRWRHGGAAMYRRKQRDARGNNAIIQHLKLIY